VVCLLSCIFLPIMMAERLGISVKQLFINAWLFMKGMR
jgi:hypothetical protein